MKALLPIFCVLFGLVQTTPLWGQGSAIIGDPEQVSEARVETESKLITAFGLAAQGKTAEALAIYRDLLAADPTNSAAAYSAARLLQSEESGLEEAVKLMQQAFRADPSNDYIALALAEVLTEADRHLLAADVYGSLFSRKPNEELYLLRQTQALTEGGKPEAGLKALQLHLVKGGRLSPKLGQQRFTLAVSMNDAEVATRALEELIAAYPSDPEYYQELAQFYRRTGNELAAKQVWERMAARFPNDERASLGLAGQGKLNDEEQAFIDRLMPLFEAPGLPIDAKILQLLPIVQEVAERGDTVLANRVLPLARMLTEVHPDEAKAFAIYADLLQGAKKDREATMAFAKTVKLDGSIYLVWEHYLQALSDISAIEELLLESENALTRFPNQARLYYYNGVALARKGDFTAAENTFQQGAILAMNDQVLRYDILEASSRLQMRQGRFGEALVTIDQALTVRPTYGPALARRAEILLRSGDESAARPLIAKAVGADARHPYVLCVEALGKVHRGELQPAKDLLATALTYGAEPQPLYHETLGDVAFLLGEEAAALASWQRAKAQGGGSHLLEQKLSRGAYVK